MSQPSTPHSAPPATPITNPPTRPLCSIPLARQRGYAILSTTSTTSQPDYILIDPLSANQDPFTRDNPLVRASMRKAWFYPRSKYNNNKMRGLEPYWFGTSLAGKRGWWYNRCGVLKGNWGAVYEGRVRRRVMKDGRRWLSPAAPRGKGLRLVSSGWRVGEVRRLSQGEMEDGEEGLLNVEVDVALSEWVRPEVRRRREERLGKRARVEGEMGMPSWGEVVDEGRKESARRSEGRRERVAELRRRRNEMLKLRFEMQEGLPPLEGSRSASCAVPALQECDTTEHHTRRSSRVRRRPIRL